MGRTITKQFIVGQVHVGEEFTTMVNGEPARVRVVDKRSVVRGTDEVELEVLEE